MNMVTVPLRSLAGVPFQITRRGGFTTWLSQDDLDRIERNVHVEDPEDMQHSCWTWNRAPVVRTGYGQIRLSLPNSPVEVDTYAPHALVSDLVNGPPPQGKVRGHRCHDEDILCPGGPTDRHRRCLNPRHIYHQGITENVQAGRFDPGRRYPKVKDRTRAEQRKRWEEEREYVIQRLGCTPETADDLLRTMSSDDPQWDDLLGVIDVLEEDGLISTRRLLVTLDQARLMDRAADPQPAPGAQFTSASRPSSSPSDDPRHPAGQHPAPDYEARA